MPCLAETKAFDLAAAFLNLGCPNSILQWPLIANFLLNQYQANDTRQSTLKTRKKCKLMMVRTNSGVFFLLLKQHLLTFNLLIDVLADVDGGGGGGDDEQAPDHDEELEFDPRK